MHIRNLVGSLAMLRHPRFTVRFVIAEGPDAGAEWTWRGRAWDAEDAYWRAVVAGLWAGVTVSAGPIRLTGGGVDINTGDCDHCKASTRVPAVVPLADCPGCDGTGIAGPDTERVPCPCVLTQVRAAIEFAS